MNTTTNLSSPYNAENFLTRWATISFKRKTALPVVSSCRLYHSSGCSIPAAHLTDRLSPGLFKTLYQTSALCRDDKTIHSLSCIVTEDKNAIFVTLLCYEILKMKLDETDQLTWLATSSLSFFRAMMRSFRVLMTRLSVRQKP